MCFHQVRSAAVEAVAALSQPRDPAILGVLMRCTQDQDWMCRGEGEGG